MSYAINPVDTDYVNEKVDREKSSKKRSKVFRTPVDISKVNLPIVQRWISDEINKQLPDDDIVIDYILELLQANGDHPDIRGIQLQLVDFLGESESLAFCERLWTLLISANEDEDGIPKQIIEERKKKVEEVDKKGKTNYNRSQYNASKRENESPGREVYTGRAANHKRETNQGRETNTGRTTDPEREKYRNQYKDKEGNGRSHYRDRDSTRYNRAETTRHRDSQRERSPERGQH